MAMKLATHWLVAGKSQLTKSIFQPIKNEPCFLKPKGGIWLSPYTPKKRHKSPWLEWCYENDFRTYSKGVVLTLPNNTRIYTIDSQRNLMDLIDEFGTNSESDWFTYWKIPNFENIALKYDGIYLTEKGQRNTHLPFKNPEFSLYSWDCCSLLLMRYKVKSQRPIALDPLHSLILEESRQAEIYNFDLQQKAEA